MGIAGYVPGAHNWYAAPEKFGLTDLERLNPRSLPALSNKTKKGIRNMGLQLW